MEDALCASSAYCAGRAAYELGRWEESRDHFEEALKTNPNDPRYKRDLLRANKRVEEEEEGSYDIHVMGDALTKTHVNLDHASYIRNTMMAMTETKGRGLFTTCAIPRGGIVLCEKAFCFPNMCDGRKRAHNILFNYNTGKRLQQPSQGALFIDLIKKLYNNPILTLKFFELDSGNYIKSGLDGELVDGVPVIDV